MGKLNKPHIFALLKPLTHSLTAMLCPNNNSQAEPAKTRDLLDLWGGPPLTLVPTALLYKQ